MRAQRDGVPHIFRMPQAPAEEVPRRFTRLHSGAEMLGKAVPFTVSTGRLLCCFAVRASSRMTWAHRRS